MITFMRLRTLDGNIESFGTMFALPQRSYQSIVMSPTRVTRPQRWCRLCLLSETGQGGPILINGTTKEPNIIPKSRIQCTSVRLAVEFLD